MDKEFKKALEKKVRDLNPTWIDTGHKRPDEKYFGLFTKKGMSILLWSILALAILANVGIFTTLYYINHFIIN